MGDGQLELGRYTSRKGRDERQRGESDKKKKTCPTLTNDAAPSPMISVTITGNTAPPSRVSSPRNTLTHQHARPSCSFEDIVNSFNFQRRALLVRARTD